VTGPPSAKPTLRAEPDWQASEALSELLFKAANLESACQTALRFVLESARRPAGALLVKRPAETRPVCLVSQDLSEVWSAQLDDPHSPLQALVSHVLESGQALSARDLPREVELQVDLAAAVPIIAGSAPQGVILLQGSSCTAGQVALLSRLAPSTGRAILAWRSLRLVQDRARELAALQMELTRMGFASDFEGLQAHMIQGACRILDGEASALVLLDEAHDEWMIRKSLGGDAEWVYQVNPKQGKGLVKECLRTGQILRVNDVAADPRFDPSSDGLSGLQAHSLLCAPLLVNGRVQGAIQVLNKRPGDFDDFDQDLLSMIAILAANAMHGTQVIQQLKVANADLEANRWELLGSRNTLRALFDNLPAGLYIIDPQYQLIVVNKGRAQRAGQLPQALVGQPCYQALFGRSDPCTDCRVLETLQTGQTTQRDERRWAAGEDPSEWEINSYPILDEKEQVTQAILLEQDITDQQRLESILAQSEKLAAVGQLAAGVAHEINNPLTAIIANAQILHRELPPDHDLQESVDLIARAGARAAQVVRNLLDFARKEDYSLGLTNLNETLERSLELVQHELLARGVRLEFHPEPSLPPILASQDHLQSVWLNLLLNAIDALEKSPSYIKITTGREGDEIQISIADNGKGIPPERLTRIFEPFYTTKAPGRGTGLGLSVSHRIVKQHGGHIRVESQLGVGSTFTVILPVS
jgi:two-component system NtrC family sensor kinase